MLNIVVMGMVSDPIEQNVHDMDAKATGDMATKHRDIVVGIKLAHYRGPEWVSVQEASSPSYRSRHSGAAAPMSELFPKIVAPTLILKADADDGLKNQNGQVTGLLKIGKIVHIKGAGTMCAERGRKKRFRS